MSLLYHPLKAIGLYSSNIPLYIKEVGKDEFYLFSAVGSYFLVYRFSNLSLIGTSDRIDETILSITGYKDRLFCGCESNIFGFTRAKHISARYEYEDHRTWKLITALEHDEYLCGVSETKNNLVIWDVETANVTCTFRFPENVFKVVSIMQPLGYQNKLLVASRQGGMKLINYLSQKVIYEFNFKCDITTVEQTPENNTVAIGFADGTVLLHNLLYDKTIMKLHSDLGSVSKISFRTDIPNQLFMLIGTVNGHVTMWDLTKQRNVGQSRDFHNCAVSTLFCVPNHALLISSSADNSLKVWNYNRPDGTPVLLRSRNGHWAPPTAIDFWPGTDEVHMEILSTGHDGTLRIFSAIDDHVNISMGRAYQPGYGGKSKLGCDKFSRDQYVLGAAVSIGTCAVRDGLWDSVVLCHENERRVTTWSHSKRTRGKYFLDPKSIFTSSNNWKFKNVSARCSVISQCGDFVVIGYSSGHVVKFNIQSGLERGSFPAQIKNSKDNVNVDCSPSAHNGNAIVSLCLGHSKVGTILVTACQQSLCAWDFQKRSLVHTIDRIEGEICLMVAHPDKDMVAIATKSGFVHLVQLTDFVVFQIIRAAFNGPINDISFCHDFQLMVVANGTLIKTFDYINNKMVDCFRVNKEVTQIKMAPNDLGIVTTHRDDVGLYVWSLRLHYIDLKLSALPIDFEPTQVTTEAKMRHCEDDEMEGDNPNDKQDLLVEVTEEGSSDQTLANDMMQLSGMPLTYLTTLLNVDQVQMKNENYTKGMGSTEFFIPNVVETLEGMKWVDDDINGDGPDNFQMSVEKKRKLAKQKASGELGFVEHFARRLAEATANNDYDGFMGFCQSLSAPIIKKEIELLCPLLNDTGFIPMTNFLRFIENQLRRMKNVDLCDVYLTILMDSCTDCLTEQKVPAGTGIEGLMETEDNEINQIEKDRAIAVQMLFDVINLKKETSVKAFRNLNQIIEMCQFGNNNY